MLRLVAVSAQICAMVWATQRGASDVVSRALSCLDLIRTQGVALRSAGTPGLRTDDCRGYSQTSLQIR
jgi:hypothetical protein